jgi:hypothetical protein
VSIQEWQWFDGTKVSTEADLGSPRRGEGQAQDAITGNPSRVNKELTRCRTPTRFPPTQGKAAKAFKQDEISSHTDQRNLSEAAIIGQVEPSTLLCSVDLVLPILGSVEVSQNTDAILDYFVHDNMTVSFASPSNRQILEIRSRRNRPSWNMPSQPISLSLQKLNVSVGMSISVVRGVPIPDFIEVRKGFWCVVEDQLVV